MSFCGRGTIDNLAKPPGSGGGSGGGGGGVANLAVPPYTRDYGPCIASVTTPTFATGTEYIFIGSFGQGYNINFPISVDISYSAPTHMVSLQLYDILFGTTNTMAYSCTTSMDGTEVVSGDTVGLQVKYLVAGSTATNDRRVDVWIFSPQQAVGSSAQVWVRDGFILTYPDPQTVLVSSLPGGTQDALLNKLMAAKQIFYKNPVMPLTTNTTDLGAPENRWRNVYVDTINTNTLRIASSTGTPANLQPLATVVDTVPVRETAGFEKTLSLDADELWAALNSVDPNLANGICPVNVETLNRDIDVAGLVGLLLSATKVNDSRLLNLEANLGYYPPFGGATLGMVPGSISSFVLYSGTGTAADLEGSGYVLQPTRGSFTKYDTIANQLRLRTNATGGANYQWYARDNGDGTYDSIGWARDASAWVVARTAVLPTNNAPLAMIMSGLGPQGVAPAVFPPPDPNWVWAP